MEKRVVHSVFPDEIGDFSDLEAPEMMYYLYYPIKDIGEFEMSIPHNLEWLKPMIRSVVRSSKNWVDRYVYVTCKHYYVEPGSYGSRRELVRGVGTLPYLPYWDRSGGRPSYLAREIRERRQQRRVGGRSARAGRG